LFLPAITGLKGGGGSAPCGIGVRGGEQGVNLEALQNHENVDIYKLAYEIIEQYFSDEVRRLRVMN
jgi:hypothetical protein